MEARQYRELLDISLSPQMKIEYYEALREKYQTIIFPKRKELPPPAPGPALEAGSEDAKILMMSLGASMKRNLGYGR